MIVTPARVISRVAVSAEHFIIVLFTVVCLPFLQRPFESPRLVGAVSIFAT
jgi:hypothetical protein